MLTMRGPIKLQIGAGLAVTSDGFCQRLQANYDLLRARYTPKDLLFLLTAPPELPENQGSMTTLVTQNNLTDRSSVVVDVVNHVVNRILLDGSSRFTYQDQVYITSVLNRLGITQVETFMEQVRQLRTQNESVVRLTELYHQQLRQLVLRQAAGEATPKLPLPASRADADNAPGGAPPAPALHTQIFQRLDTAQIYETVHAFQKSYVESPQALQHNQLRLAEHLRISNLLQLNQLKQQVYADGSVTQMTHLNHFETGGLLPPPESADEVLSQAAVSALVNVVDRTVVERLRHTATRRDNWLQLSRAIHQTAESTLSRFETYHSQGITALLEQQETTLPGRTFYGCELREFYEFYRQVHTEQAQSLPQLPPISPSLTQLTHLLSAQAEELPPEAAAKVRTEILRQRLTEATRELSSQTVLEQMFPLRPAAQPRRTDSAAGDGPLPPQTFVFHTPGQTAAAEAPAWASSQPPPTPSLAVPPPPAMVQHVPISAEEAEQTNPELLLQELSRIEQRNRTMMQTVQQAQLSRTLPSLPTPDPARTMHDALRALTQPEAVLRELEDKLPTTSMAHAQLPAQLQAIMQQADPATRTLYETLLRYGENPEAVLAQGYLRPGNPGALNAQLQLAVAEQQAQWPADPAAAATADAPFSQAAPLTLEYAQQHIVRETERVHDQSQQILQQLQQLPLRRQATAQAPAGPPPAVSFVHKQAQTQIDEELLEQLQTNTSRTVKTTDTSEVVTRQQSHQTEHLVQEQQLVTETTQDITALINRTLAKQMRTISDQVYHQMEKRLQTERSRRGRL